MKQSIGLKYNILKDGTSCEVSGIGTCTDIDIIIPSTYNGKQVTGIAGGAFYDCSDITNIKIQSGVIKIGASAFRGCSKLKGITIPYGVNSISNLTFADCSSLRIILIPSSVEQVCSYAFDNCKGIKFVYYQGSEEQWKRISIGEGNDALINAPIKYIIEDSIEKGNYSVGLKYTLSKDRTYYEVSGIGECSDTYVVIPSRYNKIPIAKIGRSAFYGCKNIKYVEISEGIIDIEDSAFRDCTNLISVALPNSVTSIGNETFRGCKELNSITIPYSVKKIGHSVFSGCSSLYSIKIPSGVTNIGGYMFFNCNSLNNISIPSTVLSIGSNAFMYCSSLKNVYYDGTKEQWNKITMYWGNYALVKVGIKFKCENAVDLDGLGTDIADADVCDECNIEDDNIRALKKEIEKLKQPIPVEEYIDPIIEKPITITNMKLQDYYLEIAFSQRINSDWSQLFLSLYRNILAEYEKQTQTLDDKSPEKKVLSYVILIFQEPVINEQGIRVQIKHNDINIPEIKQIISQFIKVIQSVLRKIPDEYIALKKAPFLTEREEKIKAIEAQIQQIQTIKSINDMLGEMLSTSLDNTDN